MFDEADNWPTAGSCWMTRGSTTKECKDLAGGGGAMSSAVPAQAFTPPGDKRGIRRADYPITS